MLPIQFPGNSQYMRYEYHRVREGPNYFVTYYKHSSRLIYDPKDAWRTLEVAKHTDTGKALKEWCLEMYDQYSLPGEEVGRVDTSFASDEEPNDNTKMVT